MPSKLLKQRDVQAVESVWRRYNADGAPLRDIQIGNSNAWEILKYEIAESYYAEEFTNFKTDSGLKKLLRCGQWDPRVLKGLLDSKLWPFGRLLETAQILWRSRGFQKYLKTASDPAGVLFCGYMNSAPTWAETFPNYTQIRTIRFDDYFKRQLKALNKQQMPSQDGVSMLTSEDFRYGQTIERRALRVTTRRLARQLRRVVLQFRITERVILEMKPNVCVIPDEREPLALLVAKLNRSLGIKTLSVSQMSDQWLRRVAPTELYSDLYCLWNSTVADHICRSGLDRKKIALVGFPDFERPTPNPPAAHRPVVLFAGQGLADETSMVRRLSEIIKSETSAEFVLRPHPRQSLSLSKMLYPRINVSRSFQNPSVVVTHSSMMAIETALRGRPVVIWNPTGCPELLPLLSKGYAQWTFDDDSLKQALFRSLSPRARTKTLPFSENLPLDTSSIFREARKN